MAILVPFAIVEKGLQVLAAPFKALGNWFSKKPPSHQFQDKITSAPPSEHENESVNTHDYSVIARLLDESIARRINANTQETVSRKGTAMDILEQFEKDLEETENVVTLSTEDFDKLNKYVLEKNDPAITERFQKSCDKSLRRANLLSPHKPSEVDAIINEIERSEEDIETIPITFFQEDRLSSTSGTLAGDITKRFRGKATELRSTIEHEQSSQEDSHDVDGSDQGDKPLV